MSTPGAQAEWLRRELDRLGVTAGGVTTYTGSASVGYEVAGETWLVTVTPATGPVQVRAQAQVQARKVQPQPPAVQARQESGQSAAKGQPSGAGKVEAAKTGGRPSSGGPAAAR